MRALFFVLLLSACTTFPSLDAVLTPVDRAAAYPALIPLDAILAQADAAASTAAPDMSTRIARLNARAAALRAPVLPAADRARLAQSVAGRARTG